MASLRKKKTAEVPSVAQKSEFPKDPVAGLPSLSSSKLCQVLAFGFLCLLPYVVFFFVYNVDRGLRQSILANLLMSVAGFIVTVLMVPVMARYAIRKNLFGYDLNKKGTPAGAVKIPESSGLIVGVVYVVVVMLFQYFFFKPDSTWLEEYNAALASVIFMLLLGFVDDVFDLPWRIKLFLPSVAALPLLFAYAGHTTILIPKPFRAFLGVDILDLGKIYHLIMGLLAVFCTNAINIHAGVNGLEVGQTIVIACAILFHNAMNIRNLSGLDTFGVTDSQQGHAFSIYLMQPLVGTCLGLLTFNWYPSSVFVGDTFTYFAGMTLAVAGILGHFSETLAVFFLPQVLNFLYSVPQLFKIVPCPRHRLPTFDPKTGLLTGTKDMNLVNLFLRVFGSVSERQLCIRLLLFQVLSCIFCFALRYVLTGWYK